MYVYAMRVSVKMCVCNGVSVQTHSTQHTQQRTGHVILTPLHTHILTRALTAYAYIKEYIFINILYTF